ncbi:uncharacterized protein [Lepeophtheirus salmonis]|uniref:uncharacterized protein n=1 Tax=Lepeophtheirus salmonis TaxID=72036 RepID=UPI001AEAF9D4|nr:uncharacterized protein LOC121126061 [Lepeophtheirus salmonis]
MRVISNPKFIRRILKGTSVRDYHLSVVVRFKRSNQGNRMRKKNEYHTLYDEYDGDDEMTEDDKPSEPNDRKNSISNVKMSRFGYTWPSPMVPISEEDSPRTSNE